MTESETQQWILRIDIKVWFVEVPVRFRREVMKFKKYIAVVTLMMLSGAAHATTQCSMSDFPQYNLNQRIVNTIIDSNVLEKDHLCGKVNVAYHWAQKIKLHAQYSDKWYEAVYWCTKKLKHYSFNAAMDYAKADPDFSKSNPAWKYAWPVNYSMYDYAGYVYQNANNICLGSGIYPPPVTP